MKNRLVSKCLPVVCILASGLSTNMVLADWSDNQSRRGYNHGYGDFPPHDIDQQLLKQLNTEIPVKESQSQGNSSPTTANNSQAETSPAQTNTSQIYQQPNYGNYYQNRGYNQGVVPGYYPGTSFNGPWNNRGSSISGPWNNNGSSFSFPWDNNGSSFSPRGNRGGWNW